MKKRKLKKSVLILGIIIIVIIVTLLSLVFNAKSGNKNPLFGSWVSPGGTIYKFDKNNKGVMIVPLFEYEFTYKIDGSKVSIDYKDKKANDAEYEYTLKKDELTLNGKRGTFTFVKKQENNEKDKSK